MSHVLDPGGWPARDIPFLQGLAPGRREWALRMFFPARCVLCDAVMPPDAGLLLCEPCHCVLEPEPPVWQACPDWPELDAWYSPFPYAGGVEHAIRQMKYNGQPRHARTLAFLMAQAIREMPECPDFSAVIPCPCTRKAAVAGIQSGIPVGRGGGGGAAGAPAHHLFGKRTANTRPERAGSRGKACGIGGFLFAVCGRGSSRVRDRLAGG